MFSVTCVVSWNDEYVFNEFYMYAFFKLKVYFFNKTT